MVFIMYFLYSTILTSNNETIKNIFYCLCSEILKDDIEIVKIDYQLKDNDINNDFKNKLINTIDDLDNKTYSKFLKRLNENYIL